MTNEAEEFLRLLHGNDLFCAFQYPIKPIECPPKIFWFRADQAREMIEQADFAANYGIQTTASVVTFRFPCPRGRGSRDFMRQMKGVYSLALWVDFDGYHHSDSKPLYSPDGPYGPTLIVDSGRGQHFYWLLQIPYELDSNYTISRFEAMLKVLAIAFGGDKKAANVSECLKPVGVRPIKAPTRIVRLSYNSGFRYDFEELFSKFLGTRT